MSGPVQAPRLLLTPIEVAHALHLGKTKVHELLADGTLESVTIGRCRRVPIEALEAFVAELRESLRFER